VNRLQWRGKDIMTPVAIVVTFVCVLYMMISIGISPTVLLKPGPMILTIGGAIFASAAGLLAVDAAQVPKVAKRAMASEPHPAGDTIVRMVGLAKIARKEGLLALDRESESIEDPFFRKGLQMVVDGLDPEEIRSVMEGEINALSERHNLGAKFFLDAGGLSPTLGIIGTVIGLVKVLASIQNVDAVGPAVAGAFVATLWGVFMANVVWLPVANKLVRISAVEILSMEVVVEGLIAIQSGASPTRIEARLLTFLPPKERAEVAGNAERGDKGERAA
jgi:chemotaxis protein MotA